MTASSDNFAGRVFEKVFVGIDPGKQGGIAIIEKEKLTCYQLGKLQLRDVWELLRVYHRWQIRCIIELVTGYIPQEGNDSNSGGQPASRAFEFGRNYGQLEGVLTGLSIHARYIPPRVWQKQFHMKRNKDESKQRWKSRLKSFAQELFPNNKIVLATSDAALLAQYCRLLYTGEIDNATRIKDEIGTLFM